MKVHKYFADIGHICGEDNGFLACGAGKCSRLRRKVACKKCLKKKPQGSERKRTPKRGGKR